MVSWTPDSVLMSIGGRHVRREAAVGREELWVVRVVGVGVGMVGMVEPGAVVVGWPRVVGVVHLMLMLPESLMVLVHVVLLLLDKVGVRMIVVVRVLGLVGEGTGLVLLLLAVDVVLEVRLGDACLVQLLLLQLLLLHRQRPVDHHLL